MDTCYGERITHKDIGGRGSGKLIEMSVELEKQTRGSAGSTMIEKRFMRGLLSQAPFGICLNEGEYGASTDPEGLTVKAAGVLVIHNMKDQLVKKVIGYNLRRTDFAKTRINKNVQKDMLNWLEPVASSVNKKRKRSI